MLDLKKVMTSEGQEMDAEVPIGFSSFDTKLGSFPIREKTTAALHLANRENKKLLISGTASLTLLMPCDRCLTEVSVPLTLTIEKEIPLHGEGDSSEENEEDEQPLAGTQLDVDQLIFDEVLMNRPEKVLCREDCKGICPSCGCNLNEKECGCDRTVRDPRMAKFLDFLE